MGRASKALPLAVVLLLPQLARAATVWLPNGADWVAVAPAAGAFANDATAFLSAISTDESPLAPRQANNDAVRETGLGLLSAQELGVDGVDLDRPWTMFERRDVVYLDVFVADRARFEAALDAWGRTRGLHSRRARTLPDGAGLEVTFGRTAGSRAAAGYLLARDRAVVMLTPARTPELREALAAVEGAAPVRAPSTGTLLVWTDSSSMAKDAWLVVRASSAGLGLSGSARVRDDGWLELDRSRSSWLTALTAATAGSDVMRARFVAGPRGAEWLASKLDRDRVDGGPGELVVERLVAPEADGSDVTRARVAKLFAPKLVDAADVVAAESIPSTLACPRGRPLASLRLDASALDRSLGGIGFFGALRDPLLLALYGLHTRLQPVANRLEPLVILACESGRELDLVGHWSVRP